MLQSNEHSWRVSISAASTLLLESCSNLVVLNAVD
jgi:hypothetical protein